MSDQTYTTCKEAIDASGKELYRAYFRRGVAIPIACSFFFGLSASMVVFQAVKNADWGTGNPVGHVS